MSTDDPTPESAEVNRSEVNGDEVNGQEVNGQEVNGQEVNGHGAGQESADNLGQPGLLHDPDIVVVTDAGPVHAGPKPSKFRRALRAYPYIALAAALVVLGASRIKTNSVAYAPGSASDLTTRITLSGAPSYKPNGSFLLATVGLTDRLTVPEWIRASLDPDIDLQPYSKVFPSGRQTELTRSRAMMDDSKTLATLAALRYLGRDGTGAGAKVFAIEPNFPADGKLSVGDVVTHVDGASICVAGDLRAGIVKAPKGAEIALTVKRSASQAVEEVRLVPKIVEGFPLIGVAVESVKCDLPITVDIDTDNIGGPSAGLSMTLAIIDLLTPGELTGGVVVGVTGTIEADGSVGDVGGVKQKTAGVRSAGAKLFLVPPGEAQEARSRAGRLPVVAVASLAEAMEALRQNGGQSLPSPRATP
jgi:Lon-like protease